MLYTSVILSNMVIYRHDIHERCKVATTGDSKHFVSASTTNGKLYKKRFEKNMGSITSNLLCKNNYREAKKIK